MQQVSPGERVLGIIGYLPLLFLLPVKIKKDSMFSQFHGRQSGVLFLTWVLLTLLIFILVAALPKGDATGTSVWNDVQTGVLGIGAIFTIIYALLMLMGMFKVALGERYRMPVIADIALLLRL
ncbi:MAG: hypothetical protein ACPHID_02460 [Thermoplasmatota archaeon]